MGFKCSECETEFETRKEMATHVYHEHTKGRTEPKKFAIPKELIKELSYLGDGCFAIVTAEGYLTKRGLEVDRFTMK